MPHEAEARESDGAEAPSVAEATEGEAKAPQTSEAGAPRTTEAEVAEAGAPKTTEARVVEAGVSTANPAAQEAEIEVGQASTPPSVQGPPPSRESVREVEVHSISSNDTSRGKEVADAEVASTRSSEPQLLAREARPSCRYNLSPAGGITHMYCGRAGMTLRGSLCSPSRTRPRGGAGALSSNSAVS